MRKIFPAALAALTLIACSDDGTNPVPGPAPVHSIAVSPGDLTLAIGSTTDLEVILFDADDNVLSGRTITFVSEGPQFATVSNTGRVTAVATGTTRIFITSEGKTTWVETEVAEIAPAVVGVQLSQGAVTMLVGDQLQLAAVALDDQGQPIPGLPVSWSSDRPGTATVNAHGQVQAFAAGTTVITATIGGRSAAAVVTVTAPPVPVLTSWSVTGVGRGPVTTALLSDLLEQTELITRRRITELVSGRLEWNQAEGTWSQRLVVRRYLRTDVGGNVIVGEVEQFTYDDQGTMRDLSPMGWTEFASTRFIGQVFNGYPYAGGMETWQRFDDRIGPVYLQYARD